MRMRSFLILAAVTVAVTGAAVLTVIGGTKPHSEVAAAGPVLPGLADHLGDVAAVVVREEGRTLTVHRVADGWALAEYADYPAKVDKVREVVRALVQLEKVEAKSARADRWARLSVEDVGAPGAKSKEVILRNAAGEAVAQLIVGKSGSGTGGENSTYVRVPGDGQAWLARGTVAVDATPGDWVERRLFDVPAADVRQIRIVHPDKSTLTIVREDSGGFRVAELPAKDKDKLKRADLVDQIVEVPGDVSLDDLARLDAAKFPADGTTRVSVTRNDGTVISFDVAGQGDERWLRFADGKLPAGLPAVAAEMAFRVPVWKVSPLDHKLAELLAAPPPS